MNELEHAVIEAARACATWVNSNALAVAVMALEEHEQVMAAAGLTEIPWAQVTDGDELRSSKGNFFPVTGTKREWKMGSPTGKFLITVRLPTGDRVLTRPSPAEPQATVRRGDTGKVVDTFVHVFESGELE